MNNLTLTDLESIFSNTRNVEQPGKTSPGRTSVVYKTTISSLAKDVRRRPPSTVVDKENLAPPSSVSQICKKVSRIARSFKRKGAGSKDGGYSDSEATLSELEENQSLEEQGHRRPPATSRHYRPDHDSQVSAETPPSPTTSSGSYTIWYPDGTSMSATSGTPPPSTKGRLVKHKNVSKPGGTSPPHSSRQTKGGNSRQTTPTNNNTTPNNNNTNDKSLKRRPATPTTKHNNNTNTALTPTYVSPRNSARGSRSSTPETTLIGERNSDYSSNGTTGSITSRKPRTARKEKTKKKTSKSSVGTSSVGSEVDSDLDSMFGGLTLCDGSSEGVFGHQTSVVIQSSMSDGQTTRTTRKRKAKDKDGVSGSNKQCTSSTASGEAPELNKRRNVVNNSDDCNGPKFRVYEGFKRPDGRSPTPILQQAECAVTAIPHQVGVHTTERKISSEDYRALINRPNEHRIAPIDELDGPEEELATTTDGGLDSQDRPIIPTTIYSAAAQQPQTSHTLTRDVTTTPQTTTPASPIAQNQNTSTWMDSPLPANRNPSNNLANMTSTSLNSLLAAYSQSSELSSTVTLENGWRETKTAQQWDSIQNLSSDYPQMEVFLSVKERETLDEHTNWLNTQKNILWSMVPDHLKTNDDGVGIEDIANKSAALPPMWEEEAEDSDSDHEPVDGKKEAGGGVGVSITSSFIKEVFTRWKICKKLNHLPTLNMFYNVFDYLLLIGRNLHVILHKRHLSQVMECMQYNPKLNSKLSEWPLHQQAIAQRCHAVALSASIADLATTVYTLQYMKDRVIPCVCDEARYMGFNNVLSKAKHKLVSAIVQDRKILKQLFSVLRESNGPNEEKTHCLQFLKELFELFKTDYQEDSSNFWRTLLMDHALVLTLTQLLERGCLPLTVACIDVIGYLIDEECRPVLQLHLVNTPQFLYNVVTTYINKECSIALALHLQQILPMLTVNPQRDVLPIFYSACEATLNQWLAQLISDNNKVGVAGGASLPRLPIVNSFIEMMSLCIHHHFRSFDYQSDSCIVRLLNLIAALWKRYDSPMDTLVAANKGILSVLHLHNEKLYDIIRQRGIFVCILSKFNDGNNLISSSTLTLLHTILQLDIHLLIEHIDALWYPQNGPIQEPVSFVQSLFHQKMTNDDDEC